ncbi:MAG: argininosuccinate lyase [Planctomycetes bacterium]|nr:argininosuccinate lyase [Planctomycetota bacterium]
MQPEKKLWAGRFEKPVSSVVERFSESISFDRRLYRQDLAGSRAHAKMLAACGLLTPAERDAVLAGLNEIEAEIEQGRFTFRADREDIHLNIEAALIERIGDAGRKLHTGRSRNDQVAVDVRLFVRQELDHIRAGIRELQRALFHLAEANADLILPGYTHLQRAQPVLASHHFLAYLEQLERDSGRLEDCRARLNLSPLGACALAGTSLPIDRHATAHELGFDAPLSNSLDAVSDRDYLVEFLSALAILAMHLSRLAEEWVLWTTEEFGILAMDDSVATGSSIMPQKKNPDPMELVRGKAARVYANLLAILTLTKGLPQAYNRDLQEDKQPLFDSVDTVQACLEVCREFARNIRFREDRIRATLESGFLDATTLAEYLVLKGMPFRSAHEAVGSLVRLCISRGIPLKSLKLEEFQAASGLIEADVYQVLGVENAVTRFQSFGSTGPVPVRQQLEVWRCRLFSG